MGGLEKPYVWDILTYNLIADAGVNLKRPISQHPLATTSKQTSLRLNLWLSPAVGCGQKGAHSRKKAEKKLD